MSKKLDLGEIQAAIDSRGLDSWAVDQGAEDLKGTGLNKDLRDFLSSRRRLSRALSKIGVDIT